MWRRDRPRPARGDRAARNRYTRLVGIDHPVVQEGLGPFRTPKIAAAVSQAGGLGTERAQTTGDTENSLVMAGQVAGAISELVSIADFVPGIVNEARAVLDKLARPGRRGE